MVSADLNSIQSLCDIYLCFNDSPSVSVIYLTCAMGTAAVSVVVSVFILAIHYNGSQKKPPQWIKRIVKFSLLKLWKKKLGERKDVVETIHINGAVANGRPHSAKVLTNDISKTDDAVLNIPNQVNTDSNHQQRHLDQNQHQLQKEGLRHLEELYASGGADESLSVLMLIYKQLDYLMSKYRDKEETKLISEEWRQLAKDLDKTLFWLFSVILIIMAVIILGFIPLNKTWPPVIIGGHNYSIE